MYVKGHSKVRRFMGNTVSNKEKKRKRLIRLLCAAGVLMMVAAVYLSPKQGEFGPIKSEANSITKINGVWIPFEGIPGAYAYATSDGVFHSDCYSSDGFYVEASGVRFLTKNILGAEMPMRNSWFTAKEANNFDIFVPWALTVQQTLNSTLKNYRTLTVYSNYMMLSSASNTSDGTYIADRLGLYKNSDINGYTLMVGTSIIGDRKAFSTAVGNVDLLAYYDYEVLRFYTNAVSRNGDLLASAIYSHWMDVNEQGLKLGEWVRIGDTMVRYIPGDGRGLYEIKAAF